MITSTTHETSANSNNDNKKNPFLHGAILRSISTLEPDEFDNLITKEYGAYWGTLKFEDSLSDYSNEVKFYYLNRFFLNI
jgi:hypothetical protein